MILVVRVIDQLCTSPKISFQIERTYLLRYLVRMTRRAFCGSLQNLNSPLDKYLRAYYGQCGDEFGKE